MNEVQNFANFHTCYLPYGLKFFHKGHPKHKLNYSWPRVDFWNTNCHADFLLGRSFKIISPTSVISRSSQLEPPLIQPQFIFYKFENTY